MRNSWIALEERIQAMGGKCPSARICYDTKDLAEWFRSLGIAAGVNKRSSGIR